MVKHKIVQTKLNFEKNPSFTPARRPRQSRKCTSCSGSGALVSCAVCSEGYHLQCAGETESSIGISWACFSCAQTWEQKFEDENDHSTSKQNSQKAKLVQKTLKRLLSSEKEKQFRRFEARHPELVKGGKVIYPIEDSLLVDKELHGENTAPKPALRHSECGEEILGDLLYICDFVWCFGEYLGMKGVGHETLHQALKESTETAVFRNYFLGLLKPVVVTLLKKENMDRSHYHGLFYLTSRAQKLVAFPKLLQNSYLTFLEAILSFKGYEDITQDLLPHSLRKKLSQYPVSAWMFSNYSVGEKLQLLSVLCCILVESAEFYQEISRRNEAQVFIRKKKQEIRSKIRNIEKTKKAQITFKENLAELKEELNKQNKELTQLRTRTESLGKDKDYKEYFHFKEQPDFLFVKAPVSLTSGNNKESSKGYWYYYQSEQEIQDLTESLSEKGIRESQLLNSLNKLLSNFKDKSENDSTSSETDQGDEKTTGCLKTDHESLKNCILSIKADLEYQFQIPEIDLSDSLDSLKDALELLHNSTCPDEELPKKRRDQGVWGCYTDMIPYWGTFLENSKSVPDLFIPVKIFEEAAERYLEAQKPEPCPQAENRRSRRLRKLRKIREEQEVWKNQDVNCYVCGELGMVVCCDTCPRVAHLNCLGIENVPEGEWNCPECIESIKYVRVTRNRAKKYCNLFY